MIAVAGEGEPPRLGLAAGDEDTGVEMRESQGLGTRGLSDSDSPNIIIRKDFSEIFG